MKKQFNDDVLFSRITADDASVDLIHRWLNNTELDYNEFAGILEMADLKDPFCLSHSKDPDYRNMLMVKADEMHYIIWLGFFDTDSSGALQVIPCDGDSVEPIREYLVKNKKLHKVV